MNHNMFCDIKTGVCGSADESNEMTINFEKPDKTIDMYYVTDPICSHCWALEPVLRRFLIQYGEYFNFHTVMGGLLEKWDDSPIDPGHGIYKPSDVAVHWREVGEHSRMPIDGSLMIDNPVTSSYPPSRVFKIIQQKHDDTKAFEYLRRARVELFVFNKNISEDPVNIEIVNDMGLDGNLIVCEAGKSFGQQLLNEDFSLARSLGATGFPTIVLINNEQKGVRIVGSRPFENYVDGLKQALNSNNIQPREIPSFKELLKEERLLFSKEIEVMYDINQSNVEAFVQKELLDNQYKMHRVLGELYVSWKELQS